MAIFVANESGAVVDEQRLVDLSRHVLADLGVAPLAELSVLLVDIDTMEKLHIRYMDEPGPTDVLAFPQDELDDRPIYDDDDSAPPTLLGDVVLCPEVATAQARSVGHTMTDELDVLCTHGILHLLGYDHGEPEEEQEMFRQQARLLAAWRGAAAGTRP
ncbi:MAG: putative rRNA maturation factor [Frankiaceae bacterium]|nr:putative rRNA maturation factor [Frankiaceae bacterium]